MNLIELYIRVYPESYREKDKVFIKVYREQNAKETEKQMRCPSKNFGHDNVSLINKDILDIVQKEDSVFARIWKIERWIYVKEDEKYNETELKNELIQSVLDEINNRREILNSMEELVKTL